MNEIILSELDVEIKLWESLGYKIAFGLEQEYEYTQKEGIQTVDPRLLHRAKQRIGRRYDDQEITGYEGNALLRMVEALSPEELIRFELEDEHKALLNTAESSEGYYDPKYQGRVMEISFQKTDPVSAVANFNRVLSRLVQLNTEYGKAAGNLSAYKTDINFSIVDGNGINLMNPINRDQRTLAIAEGLMRYVYDAAPVFMRKHRITQYLQFQNIDIGIVRAGTIRLVDDNRFETRLDHNPVAGEHIALTLLTEIRAARFGFMRRGIHPEEFGTFSENAVGESSIYETVEAKFGNKRIFKSNSGDLGLFFTLEVLNGAKISVDNSLEINGKHLFLYGTRYHHLQRELDPIDDSHLYRWFRQIKVNPDNTIAWPPLSELTNNPGRVQAKLDDITFGTKIPVVKSPGYTVNPGYERFEGNLFTAHLNMMANSPNFRATFGTLQDKLVAEFASRNRINLDEVRAANGSRSRSV